MTGKHERKKYTWAEFFHNLKRWLDAYAKRQLNEMGDHQQRRGTL